MEILPYLCHSQFLRGYSCVFLSSRGKAEGFRIAQPMLTVSKTMNVPLEELDALFGHEIAVRLEDVALEPDHENAHVQETDEKTGNSTSHHSERT